MQDPDASKSCEAVTQRLSCKGPALVNRPIPWRMRVDVSGSRVTGSRICADALSVV